MRVLSVFRKFLREQLRELWLLALLLGCAPFFVLIYWAVYGAGTYAPKVVLLNKDSGVELADGAWFRAGDELFGALAETKAANGQPALRVIAATDLRRAEEMLRHGKAHALVELSPGFSRALHEAREGRNGERAVLSYSGDLANTGYLVAAVLALNAASAYVDAVAHKPGPIEYVERPLGGSGARSDLDIALPGLFILAVILLIFPTCMALAREAESGALRRLQLTRVTSFELLAGFSLVQVLIGACAVLLTFGTAVAVGFNSQGPLWVAILIGAVTSFSCIGVGLLVACFSRTVTEAFIIGNFPLMLLMFFSGAMIPVPKIPVFSIGSVTVGLFDVLPTTHAVVAMNRIVGLGSGLSEIAYELTAMAVLSVLFFAAGVWFFQRRRMAPA